MIVSKRIILTAISILSFVAVHMVMVVSIVPAFVIAFDIGDPIHPPRYPVGAFESPPQIVMEYNNKEYDGVLRTYVFEHGDVDPNVQTSPPGPGPNITGIIPEQTVNVTKGSSVRFTIEGNTRPEIQPDSLSVTAYDTNGDAIKLLTLVPDDKSDSFIVDLKNGEYILLATAVWLPGEDVARHLTIGGSAVYAYKINVI
ncbi:MAG: hypothetical protein ACRD8W_03615 [Nitrososphaeraceae archaeon]